MHKSHYLLVYSFFASTKIRCLSHTATLHAIKSMSIGHNNLVLDWRDSFSAKNGNSSTNTSMAGENDCGSAEPCAREADYEVQSETELIPEAGKESALRTDRTASLIGDNFDTSIAPRDMRIDSQ